MPQPDILIERDRISVVGGTGPEETNGTERGDLEVTTAQGDPASIKLNADRANLTVGGGSGNAPEGDLRLLDRNANPRVQVTAESGNRNQARENAVWIQGATGRLSLGNVDESGTVDPSVTMAGSTGRIELRDPSLNRFDGRGGDASVELDGETATIAAGNAGDNPNPSPGRLSLRNRDGDQAVEIAGEARGATRKQAGTASFYDSGGNKTGEVRGDRAALKLGFSTPGEIETPSTGGNGSNLGPGAGGGAGVTGSGFDPGAGESGKILLDDGGGSFLGSLGASTVFKIEATQGRLEITTTGASQPLFVVDAANGNVKIPGNWSYDKL